MDSVTYEIIRARRPELKLPSWRALLPTDKHKARRMTPGELIAKRTAKLLVREAGHKDRSPEHATAIDPASPWNTQSRGPAIFKVNRRYRSFLAGVHVELNGNVIRKGVDSLPL